MSERFLEERKESFFPNLKRDDYRVTSDETSAAKVRYNCIAHAVGENAQWWWPDGFDITGYDVHWPAEVAREHSLNAFIAVFQAKGFVPCDDVNGNLEPGFEKVAIYCDTEDLPTHAARQLTSGDWSSKLGDWEDIEHKTLACLESKHYGSVAKILKPQTQSTP